ncbi:metallophosphoesterase family protein [Thiohalocapsa marina]|uniref:Metallophosphoesterase family protein n=1 Tax=Thiohalocapsa marina TaxID=424902 RepID=A0A5M8FRX8_9GAMM|nr:metallophosphoesterase family protein [Thiohalocapsa marina]KAA6186571.1 metallophosphoesterase family protein [Thiohalocapsa marina]
MKVAVFSDVQANLPAMEEALAHIDAWGPDMVVMAGDLVNRGPDSLGCLMLFDQRRRASGWLPVNGNHEVWVLRCGVEPPVSVGERDIRRFTDFAWRQVAEHADLLRDWPDHLCLHPPGAAAWLHVTHGTMAGNRDGITPNTSDESLAGKLPEGVALFVSGHTHRPHQRRTQDMDVVNVGSVGSPFDGDPRGSYGQFTWQGGRWHSRIVRFAYDRARAERDFEDSGFLDEGGPLAHLIFREWRDARLLMGGWRRQYERLVYAGEIGLQDSIDRYLRAVEG